MRTRIMIALLLLALTLAGGCSGHPTDEASDIAFLKEHGWTVTQRVATHRLTLPARFVDEPGAFPVGFYWAYNNVLSGDVGLDMAPLAGKRVTATLYALKESLQDDNPNRQLRAVVVRQDGQIVGAYLDRLGHFGFAASLKGRTVPQITGKDFGAWLTEAGVVDWNHPDYRRLAALTPPEVIQAYYGLLESHAYKDAWKLHSLSNRAVYLFANRDPVALYNDRFSNRYGGPENIRSAVVRRIAEPPHDLTAEIRPGAELNRKVAQALQYSVSLDLRFARETTEQSGGVHYFVGAVREVEGAPWLLDSWGTGP